MRIFKHGHLCIGVLFVALGAGCSTAKGSGNIKTETRTINGVSSVSLLGDGMLDIEQTGTDSLTITADDNLLPLLNSEVRDGELKLGVKNLANIEATKQIQYKLTVKGLTALSLTGDAEADVKKLATDRFKVNITGDASIRIDGTADDQSITILGDGKYDGTRLTSKTANVSITGDGHLDIAASDKLDVKILGDGKINYTGDPVITKSIIGDGKIEKK
jgi:hypothetical protein